MGVPIEICALPPSNHRSDSGIPVAGSRHARAAAPLGRGLVQHRCRVGDLFEVNAANLTIEEGFVRSSLRRMVVALALIGSGWILAKAQTSEPDFEIVVNAPTGQ